MSDISDKKRLFLVHAHCNCANADGNYYEATVEAGEDADVVCSDVLDNMLANHFDNGWGETTEDELIEYGVRRRKNKPKASGGGK